MPQGRKKGHTIKGLLEIQEKARTLIEVDGKTQREVAEIIDITEGTLSEWVTKFKWLSRRKSELLASQEKCKHLIEVEGLSLEEVCKITNVSLPTLSRWIAHLNYKRVDMLAIKRNDAKRLLTENGFNQKEVAVMVDVSAKTVGVWVKRYNWRVTTDLLKCPHLTNHEFATGFKQHAMLFAPRQAEKICSLVDEYLNSLDTST